MSTEDAVAHGIKSTAGVVTSAAIVMVAGDLLLCVCAGVGARRLAGCLHQRGRILLQTVLPDGTGVTTITQGQEASWQRLAEP